MSNNYVAKEILAKEQYFQAQYNVTYTQLMQERYPIEHESKCHLVKLLAYEILKKINIETHDEHEARQFRVRVYMYSREDMLRLLTEAYTRGRLDRVGEF